MQSKQTSQVQQGSDDIGKCVTHIRGCGVKISTEFDVSVTVHHIYISKEMYQLDANNFTLILFS